MRYLTTFAAFLMLIPLHLQAGNGHFFNRFELANGFIILNAQVNGRTGSYILDSGAPGLILNKQRHDLKGLPVELAGTGGNLEGTVVTPVHFNMANIKLSHIDALLIDLSYLEQSAQREIDGLIGLGVFEGQGIVIDYARQSISLTQADVRDLAVDPYISLPIETDGHVPVIRIQSNGTTLRFGIDTGSRSNLICRNVLASCDPHEVIGQVAMTGADQRTITTHKVRITSLTTSDLALGPTDLVVSDLSSTAALTGEPLDGILGYDFFSGCKVFINAVRTVMLVSRPITPVAIAPAGSSSLIALR